MPDEPNDLDRADIVVRRKDNAVVAAMPQYGLFAKADTVQAALDALDAKKKILAADFVAFNELKSDGVGLRPASRSFRWDDIGQFAVKAAIVFCLLIATTAYLAIKTQDIVQGAIYHVQADLERAAVRGGADFWAKVEREFDRAASPANEMPEEKKQKLLSNLHSLVDRWRPFVVAAAAIFTVKEPTGSQPANPGTRP
jgi:hypothetical protein